MFSKHKGNRGEAYLIYLGLVADEDFNPKQLSREHFNEFNFLKEELEYIARKASCAVGAGVVAGHPNATPSVHAIVGMLLLESESEIESIDL